MTIFDMFSLLGGLALFLYGMRIMGDGLKKNTGSTLQKALEKVTNSAFKSFLLGVLVTALVQSSKATIVLTAGLVSAGVLTFNQSIGIVLGANVGTTVTGQIIRLLDLNQGGATTWIRVFQPSTLAPIAALIGIVLIMFIKRRNSDTIGEIAMGFGILFTGLINMTAAVEPLSKSDAFINLISQFSNQPVLAFLVGAVVAFIVQSSSASVGMLQTLSSTGVLTFATIYPILMGIYVGEAITTAMMCMAGTSTEAKRTGMVTIVFNACTFVFLVALIWILQATGAFSGMWSMSMTSGYIANTHTLFKLISALVFLPFNKLYYKLCLKLVKDKKKGSDIIFEAAANKLDEKLFISPKLALNSAHSVIRVMHRLAMTNTELAIGLVSKYDEAVAAKIDANEDCLDRITDLLDEYLVHFSAHVNSEADSDMLNYCLQCFNEVERIGDHAVNIKENAQALMKLKTSLSEEASGEFKILTNALTEILEDAMDAIKDLDAVAASKIEPLEEVIDDIVAEIKNRHIRRLRKGECTSDLGLIFTDALTNIERISDQCSNIAFFTIAVHNPDITHNRHKFIHDLHHGNDEGFNKEYERQRTVYIDKL